jgi:DMSO/TMAO reductase YedYZ molybdopterin-dependent catalytic subunit
MASLEEIETVDPDEAHRKAVENGLVIVSADPLNCEAPLAVLGHSVATPNDSFYIRGHFPLPKLDPSTWRLELTGHVEHPLSLSLDELRGMPSRTLTVTLECAGNGRSLFDPPVVGQEPFGLGAVSTAEWTGVSLADVLERAAPKVGAREAILRGADTGPVKGLTEPIHFERSLSIDEIRESEAILAYAMNGVDLPIEHGYPVRAIVPRWYALASVKWLAEIEVVNRPFSGHYQGHEYMFEWTKNGEVVRESVDLMRVRSLITEPRDEVEPGEITVRGVAWSGQAEIARVEVSVNDGPWQEARLLGDGTPHSWQRWEFTVALDQPSEVTIRARATDLAGHTQPSEPERNPKGYGGNAVERLHIRCK